MKDRPLPKDYHPTELQILKNVLQMLPKTVQKRTMNISLVRDVLMAGSSFMGSTSCYQKCRELGIAPYEHELKQISRDGQDK